MINAYLNGNKIAIQTDGYKELTSDIDLNLFDTEGEFAVKASVPKNCPDHYGILEIKVLDPNNCWQIFMSGSGYWIRVIHKDKKYSSEWIKLATFDKQINF